MSETVPLANSFLLWEIGKNSRKGYLKGYLNLKGKLVLFYDT